MTAELQFGRKSQNLNGKKLWLDDFTLVRGTRAGDVLPINLKSLHPTAERFGLSPEFKFTPAGGDEEPQTARNNPIRGDWSFSHADGSGKTFILFSDRVNEPAADTNSHKFAKSGEFYLAPATGFRGTIEFHYTVDGARHSYSFDVVDGYSTTGPGAVSTFNTDAAKEHRDELRTMVLQQRLNFLGFRDESGTLLEVDGIVGIHTEAALKRFKAATDTAKEPLSKQTATLDDETVAWLNAPNAPVWVKYNGELSPAQDQFSTSWLRSILNALAATPRNDGSGSMMLSPANVLRVGPLADMTVPPEPALSHGIEPYQAGMKVDLDVTARSDLSTLKSRFIEIAAKNKIFLRDSDFQTATINQKTILTATLRPPVRQNLTQSQVVALKTGLEVAGQRLGELETLDEFGSPLPLVGLTDNPQAGVTIGNSLEIRERLEKQLIARALEYLTTALEPNVDGLSESLTLNTVETVDGGASVRVASKPVCKLIGGQLVMEVVYDLTTFRNATLELGQHARELGLVLGTTIPEGDVLRHPFLQLQSDLHLTFDIPLAISKPADFELGISAVKATVSLVEESNGQGSVSVPNQVPMEATMSLVEESNGRAKLSVNEFALNQGLLAMTAEVTDDLDFDFNNATITRSVQDRQDLSLANLQTTPLSEMLAIKHEQPAPGDFMLTGTIPISITGIADLGEGLIQLMTQDIFANNADPVVTFASPCLDAFANYTPETLRSWMVQLGDWLDALERSEPFQAEIPFTGGKTIGSVVQLKQRWLDQLATLQDSAGKLLFTTLQEFLQQIGAANIEFVDDKCKLEFDIGFNRPIGDTLEAVRTENGMQLPAGHGLDGQTVDVFWNGGELLGATVSGSGTDVALNNGTGSTLPLKGTRLVVATRYPEIDFTFPETLGSLSNFISTSGSATLQGGLDLTLRLDIDFNRLGSNDDFDPSSDQNTLTANTPLHLLNRGQGLALGILASPDPEMIVPGGSVKLTVDLPGQSITAWVAVADQPSVAALADAVNEALDELFPEANPDTTPATPRRIEASVVGGQIQLTARDGATFSIDQPGLGFNVTSTSADPVTAEPPTRSLKLIHQPANGAAQTLLLTVDVSDDPTDTLPETLADKLTVEVASTGKNIRFVPRGKQILAYAPDARLTILDNVQTHNGTLAAGSGNQYEVTVQGIELGVEADSDMDVFWSNGVRRGMTVQEVAESGGATRITLADGTGDTLPAVETPVVLAAPEPNGNENGLGFRSGDTYDDTLADLEFTLSDANVPPVRVNLPAEQTGMTLGEIKHQIQAASQGRLLVLIGNEQAIVQETNFAGRDPYGLTVIDLSQGAARPFEITAVNNSLAGATGTGLGILGVSDVPDAFGHYRIEGAPLHGQTLADHLFVEVPSLKAAASLIASGVGAAVHFGAAQAQITGGTGNAMASVELLPLSRMSVADLLESVDEVRTTAKCSGTATLPIDASLGGVDMTPNPARVEIDWPVGDCPDPTKVVARYQEFIGGEWTERTFSLPKFDNDLVKTILRQAKENFIDKLSTLPPFNTKLPGIGQNLAELLDLESLFQSIYDNFEESPAQALDDLDTALKRAIEKALAQGLTVSSDDVAVSVRFENEKLSIDLDLDKRFVRTFSLNLDQAGGLPGNLVDVNGSAPIELDVLASLSIGLDVALGSAQPIVTLRKNDTTAKASYSVLGDNIHFSAAVGPFGVAIGDGGSTNGTVVLDDNGLLDVISDAQIDRVQDRLQVTGYSTGDRVRVIPSSGVPLPTGLAPFATYFVIADESGIGLAATKNGMSIDLDFPPGATAIGLKLARDATFTLGIADDTALDNSVSLELKLSNPGTFRVDLPVFRADRKTFVDSEQPKIEGTINVTSSATTFVSPDFSKLFAANPFDAFADGWEAILGLLDLAIDRQEDLENLPFIGDEIGQALTLFRDLRDRVGGGLRSLASPSNEQVRDALFSAIAGLGWLKDRSGDGEISPDDITVTGDSDAKQIQLLLGGSLATLELPLEFGGDLGALGLSVDAMLNVGVEFSWDLNLGIDKRNGVYLDTASGPTRPAIAITATLPELEGTGKLGFFQVDVTAPSNPEIFNATATIEIAGVDGKATLANLAPTVIFAAGLIDPAQLDPAKKDQNTKSLAYLKLPIVTSFQGDARFPSIKTDIVIDVGISANGELEAPNVTFEAVQIDAGQAIGKLAKPVLENIMSVLEPVHPFIELVDTKIPLISDLARKKVTLLDLAGQFGKVSPETAKFIKAVGSLAKLAKTADEFNGSQFVNVGSFSPDLGELKTAAIDEPLPTSAFNLADSAFDKTISLPGSASKFLRSAQSVPSAQTPGQPAGLSFPLLEDPLSVISLLLGRDVDLFTYTMPQLEFNFKYRSPPYPIPFVSPFVSAYVTGRVDARAQFTFGMDTSGVRKFSDSQDPKDLFAGFYVADRNKAGKDIPEIEIDGSLTVTAETPPISEFPQAVFPVLGGLGAASVTISLSAGAGGGIFLEGDVNLNDTNRDGKVYFSELENNLQRGPGCVFDIDIEASARLFAFAHLSAKVKVDTVLGSRTETRVLFDKAVNLLDVPLFELGFACSPELSGSGAEPATPRPGGVLRLNATDQRDEFVISGTRSSVTIERNGNSKTYSNVSRIEGDLQAGDDLLQVSGDLGIPMILVGGSGDDTIHGGAGNDQIYGGTGDDSLFGGAGDDNLFGEEGEDHLEGGEGDDQLDGGEGDDELHGGVTDANRPSNWDDEKDGNDTLRGGLGSDRLYGGAGDDTLYAATSSAKKETDSEHTLVGGKGNDRIYGDGGKDIIFGDAEYALDEASKHDDDAGDENIDYDDTIAGLGGSDLVWAGPGDDSITTLEGNDTIRGGHGNDVIETGAGIDSVHAGRGDDHVTSGDGNDDVYGDDGNDTLDLGNGNDRGFGGAGDDVLFGGRGSDNLYGDYGPGYEVTFTSGQTYNDLIYAGTPNSHEARAGEPGATHIIDLGYGENTAYGDFGRDVVTVATTGNGNDLVYAFGGDDQIRVGAGNDRVFAGAGSDLIEGGEGDDELYGGKTRDGGGDLADVNTIYGDWENGDPTQQDFGRDRIYGDVGRDILYGDFGNETVTGLLGGNDTIYGLSGSDELHGGWGSDTLYAGVDARGGGAATDTDVLYGDPSAESVPVGIGHDDTIFGSRGLNRIFAYAGNDIIRTFAGNDVIDGGDGDDTIDAGDGKNVVSGGNGNDTIRTGIADDVLDGGAGNDNLSGGRGNDVLLGGTGDDVLTGGEDDDWLVGGTGNDFLNGEAGNDVLWGGSEVIVRAVFQLDFSDLENPFFAHPGNFPTVDLSLLETHELLFGAETPRMVPAQLNGLPVEGTIDDGNDVLLGGDHSDWLFGGGGRDELNGEGGDDYVDGGSGNDVVRGGAGNDIVRGGGNDDVVRGGDGIDQLFGDDGADHLFGDAGIPAREGASLDSTQILIGQRLFGGQGIDALYGYAASTTLDDDDENAADGDALFGGPGGDWLYGNIRAEKLFGESGGDTIQGYGVIGPHYADNSLKSRIGGPDTLFGGTGEDVLYGGGGNDTLWGGADSDWLEGQNGSDTLYGGGAIDKLVLDVDPEYGDLSSPESIDGHYGNHSPGDVPDDNATDILLINGHATDDDSIYIGQQPHKENNVTEQWMHVIHNGRYIPVRWRDYAVANDLNGRPLVEQFLVVGLGGNDIIEFVLQDDTDVELKAAPPTKTKLDPLDVSDLIDRSDDFVGVILGSDGDDRLRGTNARDRIDGGAGSDTLYGMGGDDQLWGDEGSREGNAIDHDQLFGGQGHDDSLGGQGTNKLFAWTLDPDMAIHLLGFEHGASAEPSTNSVNVTLTATTAIPSPELSAESLPFDAAFRLVVGDAASKSVLIPKGTKYSELASRITAEMAASEITGVGVTFSAGKLTFTSSNSKALKIERVTFGVFVDDQGQFYSTNGDLDGDGILDGSPDLEELGFADGQQSAGTNGVHTLVAGRSAPSDGRLTYNTQFTLKLGDLSPVVIALPTSVTGDNKEPADLLSDVRTAINATSLNGRVTIDTNGQGQLVFTSTAAIQIQAVPIPAFRTEDTGLNRMLGSELHDDLYGGTGLDFMYGNGAPENTPDRLFDKRGNLFESADGGVAGEEWKEYAKSTDRVWYYAGTNLADQIRVDFVTEPGLLQGHHLITRLTENSDNFTFDAQVQLNFDARDEQGKLIWNPADAIQGLAITSGGDLVAKVFGLPVAATLASELDATFSLSLNNAAPTRIAVDLKQATTSDVAKKLNDALAAANLADRVRAEFAGNRLILAAYGSSALRPTTLSVTEANDVARDKLGIISQIPSGVLTGPATFDLKLDGLTTAESMTVSPRQVNLTAIPPVLPIATYADLVADFNTQIEANDNLRGLVRAVAAGDHIKFTELVEVTVPDNPAGIVARDELGVRGNILLKNAKLTDDAMFLLRVAGKPAQQLQLTKALSSDNKTVADLVDGVNTLIKDNENLAGRVQAFLQNGALQFRSLGIPPQVSNPNAVAAVELGLVPRGKSQVGRLSADAEFALSLDGGEITTILVKEENTRTNRSVLDLVDDINAAIRDGSRLYNNGTKTYSVLARPEGNRIGLLRVNPAQVQASASGATATSLVVVTSNNVAENELFFSSDRDKAGHEAKVGLVGSNGLSQLLPPEGDFLAIIVDALDGDDEITVGPTVVKSVWTDAGRGNDRVEYVSGTPILADIAERPHGAVSADPNNSLAKAFELGMYFQAQGQATGATLHGSYLLTGLTLDSPTDEDFFQFQLAKPAVVGDSIRITSLSAADQLRIELRDQSGTVVRSATDRILDLKGLSTEPYYLWVSSNRTPTVYEVEITANGKPATPNESVIPLGDLAQHGMIQGRPLGSGGDTISYSFEMTANGKPGDQLLLAVDNDLPAGVTLELYTDPPGSSAIVSTATANGLAIIDLKDVVAGQYVIKLSDAAQLTKYKLVPSLVTSLITPIAPDLVGKLDGNAPASIIARPLHGPRDVGLYEFQLANEGTAGEQLLISLSEELEAENEKVFFEILPPDADEPLRTGEATKANDGRVVLSLNGLLANTTYVLKASQAPRIIGFTITPSLVIPLGYLGNLTSIDSREVLPGGDALSYEFRLSDSAGAKVSLELGDATAEATVIVLSGTMPLQERTTTDGKVEGLNLSSLNPHQTYTLRITAVSKPTGATLTPTTSGAFVELGDLTAYRASTTEPNVSKTEPTISYSVPASDAVTFRFSLPRTGTSEDKITIAALSRDTSASVPLTGGVNIKLNDASIELTHPFELDLSGLPGNELHRLELSGVNRAVQYSLVPNFPFAPPAPTAASFDGAKDALPAPLPQDRRLPTRFELVEHDFPSQEMELLRQYASYQDSPVPVGGGTAYFKFTLDETGAVDDQVALHVFEAQAPVELALIQRIVPTAETAWTRDRVLHVQSTSNVGQSAAVSLQGLEPGEYLLRVTSAGSARYELLPTFANPEVIQGTQRRVPERQQFDFRNPLIILRKDIILGGSGNDVLQGGPGEDWIFGQDGNDVLAGGFDRQAGDLLWGGPGDDIYQILPDDLPLTKAAQRRVGLEGTETLIPTYSDRFDGGEGHDQVLFLGGDLDINGRVVPDFAAFRWNSLLHRYEFTSRVWDINRQVFIPEDRPAPAELEFADFAAIPSFPLRLQGDLTFTVRTSSTNSVTIRVDSETAEPFADLDAFKKAIEEAIGGAASGKVTVSSTPDPLNAQAGRLLLTLTGGATLTDVSHEAKRLGWTTSNLQSFYLPTSAAQLAGDLEFSLDVDGEGEQPVTLLRQRTLDNATLADLVVDLNSALVASGLRGKAQFALRGSRIMLTTLAVGTGASLRVAYPATATEPLRLGIPTERKSGGHSASGFRHEVAFFTTHNTEETVFDLRRGNDEFHADPEYLIDGSEWGIDPADRPQRANPNLTVLGGDGFDIIYGGAGDDTLDGGPGSDVVIGGGGNDRINGGLGNDFVAGGISKEIPFDRYEYAQGGSNDDPAFAPRLVEPARYDPQSGKYTIQIPDLTFHHNDFEDWYLLETPAEVTYSEKLFAGQVELPGNTPATDALEIIPGYDLDPGPGYNVVPVPGFDEPTKVFLVRVPQQTLEFQPLASSVGGTSFTNYRALDTSPDGRYVVGNENSSGFPIFWDTATGMVVRPTQTSGQGLAVTSDGTVVGTMPPFVWRPGDANVTKLKNSEGVSYSDKDPVTPIDISDDGNVIVAYAGRTGGQDVIKWQRADGGVEFGSSKKVLDGTFLVNGISPDGRYITGSQGTPRQAFIHSTETETETSPQRILVSDPDLDSHGRDLIQLDGELLIVGFSRRTHEESTRRAVLWKLAADNITEGEITPQWLETTAGGERTEAFDISNDGQIIVGSRSVSPTLDADVYKRAGIWTLQNGEYVWSDLNETVRGIPLDWTLNTATGVGGANGTYVIAGEATDTSSGANVQKAFSVVYTTVGTYDLRLTFEGSPPERQSLNSRPYVYELAPPLRAERPTPRAGVDLLSDSRTIQEDNTIEYQSVKLRQAFAVDGNATNAHLSGMRSVGDINGDKQGDFAFIDDNFTYIVLGPLELDSLHNVADVADIIVQRGESVFPGNPNKGGQGASPGGLGQLAEGVGDVDSDGFDDLVFTTHAGVTVLYGRSVFPRFLDDSLARTRHAPSGL